MPGSRVIVQHVSRAYGDALILRDISFTVQPGEVVALGGPSGSGKTTLLQLIGSLDRPSSGTIMVDDVAVHELTHPAAFRRDTVGFVFQLHHLLPSLTVQENVELTLIAARMRKRERAERSLALLDEVGLTGRERDFPSSLSGGERQRVAVARALAGHPRLLLADEPTGALDSVASQRIWNLLLSVRENHGTTIIIASHDQTLLQHADRAINLLDGRIAEPTQPREREIA
ncbi:MAG TPA: ABC transporter ATP-binding protein [Solirubrobacteraceae bacterium]|nr:ABC transporter ATP-binding protein [Solirubrobacteraceae bacterium]